MAMMALRPDLGEVELGTVNMMLLLLLPITRIGLLLCVFTGIIMTK